VRLAEIDGFVITVKFESGFFIEPDGALIAIVDREANRLGVGQKK
jgi:hypothetical protein